MAKLTLVFFINDQIIFHCSWYILPALKWLPFFFFLSPVLTNSWNLFRKISWRLVVLELAWHLFRWAYFEKCNFHFLYKLKLIPCAILEIPVLNILSSMKCFISPPPDVCLPSHFLLLNSVILILAKTNFPYELKWTLNCKFFADSNAIIKSHDTVWSLSIWLAFSSWVLISKSLKDDVPVHSVKPFFTPSAT